MSVELPTKLWDDLGRALDIRAKRMSQSSGAEVNPTFTAWLRDSAKATIAQYK